MFNSNGSGISDMYVYLIEDNQNDVFLISHHLKRLGVNKIDASFGYDKGLKDLSELKEKPDLILVDWQMVGAGGVVFINQAKKIPALKDVKFQLMTGMYKKDYPDIDILSKEKEELVAGLKSLIKAWLGSRVKA